MEPVRLVRQSREEASYAPDRNAEDQREDERVAGGVGDAQRAFRDLDAGPPPEQPADDRLPAEPGGEGVAVGPVVVHRLEPREHLRPEQRAEDTADEDPGAMLERHA